MRHRHGGRVINIARWFVGRSMLGILIWRRLWVHLIATQPHPEYCWNYECRPLCRTRSTVDYRQSKPSSTRSILSNFAISIWLSHGSSQVLQHQWTRKCMTKTERLFYPLKTVLFAVCTIYPKQLICSLQLCAAKVRAGVGQYGEWSPRVETSVPTSNPISCFHILDPAC